MSDKKFLVVNLSAQANREECVGLFNQAGLDEFHRMISTNSELHKEISQLQAENEKLKGELEKERNTVDLAAMSLEKLSFFHSSTLLKQRQKERVSFNLEQGKKE